MLGTTRCRATHDMAESGPRERGAGCAAPLFGVIGLTPVRVTPGQTQTWQCSGYVAMTQSQRRQPRDRGASLGLIVVSTPRARISSSASEICRRHMNARPRAGVQVRVTHNSQFERFRCSAFGRLCHGILIFNSLEYPGADSRWAAGVAALRALEWQSIRLAWDQVMLLCPPEE